jgi:endonuclease/exonuclease/phosphatase family metal-dependent hydrolase
MLTSPLTVFRRSLLLVSAVALLAVGCGSDGGSEQGDSGQGGGQGDASGFEVVTYNAGLARGFVDYAVERSPEVAEAMSELEAQLVAVQEVWNPEDVQAVVDATSETHPHSFFLDPQPELAEEEQARAEAAGSDGPACPENEAVPLEDCARQNCDGVPDDQLSDCVLQSCGSEFAATCPECQTCLAANIGGSLEDILGACAGDGAGGSFAYDGAFGIGILSAEPFIETDSLVLESSLNRRAVIYVQIEDPVLGTVDVFNTHLSANLDLGESPVPYPGEGSWAEEQATQIEVMNEWIDERTSDDRVAILAGDMNTSPEGENHTAETPENYELLVSGGGWDDQYSGSADAECTYCADNLLVGGEGDTGPVLDHILIRNFDGEVTTRQVFTDPIDIEVEGEPVETNLSDHHGLATTLTPA